MAKVTTSIDFLEKRYLRAWRLVDMIRIADLMKVELEQLLLLGFGDTREAIKAKFLLKRIELELQEYILDSIVLNILCIRFHRDGSIVEGV
jgi:hypothetical protein